MNFFFFFLDGEEPRFMGWLRHLLRAAEVGLVLKACVI